MADSANEGASYFESKVREEWDGVPRAFYWNNFLEEIANLLKDDHFGAILTLCGLIKYRVKSLDNIRNISDDKEEFAQRLSKNGVPEAICDKLFQTYVAVNIDEPADKLFSVVNSTSVDGILLSAPNLERSDLVEHIVNIASVNSFVVLGSPPATGKTSLLQLIWKFLSKRRNASAISVHYIKLRDSGFDAVMNQLKDECGIDLVRSCLTKHPSHNRGQVWLLLDDAQSIYGEQYLPFWDVFVKGMPVIAPNLFEKFHCIISATYDLSTHKSPVDFASFPRIPSGRSDILRISTDEANALYSMRTKDKPWEEWEVFRDTLVQLSKGHIGVLIQGIRLLEEESKNSPLQNFCEEGAIECLHGRPFFERLRRCFAAKSTYDNIGRLGLLSAIEYEGINALESVDCENELLGESIQQLKRTGVLDHSGRFTCPAAFQYYYNELFPSRGSENPKTIEDLVERSIKSLSAAKLRATRDDGNFPKEAAFQHLFCEAMFRQLKPDVVLIPEMTTKLPNSEGASAAGSLDFYINGSLKWAIELLRKGNKFGEHASRFNQNFGKYRSVKPSAYLLLDFRGPKKRRGNVQQSENRCTLYFADDFRSCTCQMRLDTELKTWDLKE